MGENQDRQRLDPADELRCQTQKRVRTKTADGQPSPTRDETQRLVHQLEVHQVELEMQNEELRSTRKALELSRNTYAELYDFAPLGYFVFDAGGRIREVNLAGAQLLGLERQRLAGTPFSQWITDAEGRKTFSRHLALALRQPTMARCEISLRGKDGTVICGQLQSLAMAGETMGSRSHLDCRRDGAAAAGRRCCSRPMTGWRSTFGSGRKS